MEQPIKIDTFHPERRMELGRWALEHSTEFNERASAWKDKCLPTWKDSLAAAIEDRRSLQSAYKLLNDRYKETAKIVGAAVFDIQTQGIRNPAADFKDLAAKAAEQRQETLFVSGLIDRLTITDIPEAECRIKECRWRVAEAKTQVCQHDVITVYVELLPLAAALSDAMGECAITDPPKLVQFEELARRASREEVQAHGEFIEANSMVFTMKTQLSTK